MTPGARLGFDRARNLRDLGGYPVAGGLRVRSGVLYRSDSLDRLHRADRARLAALGLCRVIDLRSVSERTQAPDRLPPGVEAVLLPVFDDDNTLGKDLQERLAQGRLEGIDPDALMTEVNVQLVRSFTPQFARFLAELVAAEGRPVLFHCTAGKDRTGFAAALILRILGVSPPTIVEDYLRSGPWFLERKKGQLALIRLFRGRAAAELVRRLYGVKASYLEAAFRTIDQDWGSFDAYLRKGLGVSEAQGAALRSWLLTPEGA